MVQNKSLAVYLHDADISIVLTPSCTIQLLYLNGSYSLFFVKILTQFRANCKGFFWKLSENFYLLSRTQRLDSIP